MKHLKHIFLSNETENGMNALTKRIQAKTKFYELWFWLYKAWQNMACADMDHMGFTELKSTTIIYITSYNFGSINYGSMHYNCKFVFIYKSIYILMNGGQQMTLDSLVAETEKKKDTTHQFHYHSIICNFVSTTLTHIL